MDSHWIVRCMLMVIWVAVVGCGGRSATPQTPAAAGSGAVAGETQIAARPVRVANTAETAAPTANTEPAAGASPKEAAPIGLILPDPTEDALDPKGPKLRRD